MDITALLDLYYVEMELSPIYWYTITAVTLIIAGSLAAIFLWDDLGAGRKGVLNFLKALASGTFLGLFLAFFPVLISLAVVGTMEQDRAMEMASESITEEVQDYYGVDISPEKIREAWSADDDDLTVVFTEHDGVEKSLGIRFNEDTKTVTVFQGNEALQAVR